jgi:RNA polymerase primary sigma factor
LRSQFFKAFYSLLKELGREPTPVEISNMTDLPMDKILAILEASREPISLETPVGDDDSTLGDFLENQESESPYDAVQNRELAHRVTEVLSTLTDREEKIIRLRFGIGEKAEYTLEEIGKRFNVSRERIRQIEKKRSTGCATPAGEKNSDFFLINLPGGLNKLRAPCLKGLLFFLRHIGPIHGCIYKTGRSRADTRESSCWRNG